MTITVGLSVLRGYEAECARSPRHDGPYVALLDLVPAADFQNHVPEIGLAQWNLQAYHPGRLIESLEVPVELEDPPAIGPDALEDAVPV